MIYEENAWLQIECSNLLKSISLSPKSIILQIETGLTTLVHLMH